MFDIKYQVFFNFAYFGGHFGRHLGFLDTKKKSNTRN